MTLFIVFLAVMTLVWAAMFVLPFVGYAMIGLNLIKTDKKAVIKPVQIARKPFVSFTPHHA